MKAQDLSHRRRKEIIVWAVDPTREPKDSENIIKELKIWSAHLNCDVLPVSIFSNTTFNMPMELSGLWKEKFEQLAEAYLNRYFKGLDTKTFLPPEKIFTDSTSNRRLALELSRYSERKKAIIIFANTHSQKSWNPFRLGSFSEVLISTSRVPVFLLNAKTKPVSRIPSILFPTDFARDSKYALLNLSSWAKAFQSEVLLYSQIETPMVISSELNGYWPYDARSFESVMKTIKKSRLKKAAQWASFLKKGKIKSKILIERQKGTIASDLLEIAKKNKVGIIAMASHSGPTSQAILGSVAKDVLLQSRCPVLIFFNPKPKRIENRFIEKKREQPLAYPH